MMNRIFSALLIVLAVCTACQKEMLPEEEQRVRIGVVPESMDIDLQTKALPEDGTYEYFCFPFDASGVPLVQEGCKVVDTHEGILYFDLPTATDKVAFAYMHPGTHYSLDGERGIVILENSFFRSPSFTDFHYFTRKLYYLNDLVKDNLIRLDRLEKKITLFVHLQNFHGGEQDVLRRFCLHKINHRYPYGKLEKLVLPFSDFVQQEDGVTYLVDGIYYNPFIQDNDPHGTNFGVKFETKLGKGYTSSSEFYLLPDANYSLHFTINYDSLNIIDNR